MCLVRAVIFRHFVLVTAPHCVVHMCTSFSLLSHHHLSSALVRYCLHHVFSVFFTCFWCIGLVRSTIFNTLNWYHSEWCNAFPSFIFALCASLISARSGEVSVAPYFFVDFDDIRLVQSLIFNSFVLKLPAVMQSKWLPLLHTYCATCCFSPWRAALCTHSWKASFTCFDDIQLVRTFFFVPMRPFLACMMWYAHACFSQHHF